MYAAVPRIKPACVIAGVVIVGDSERLDEERASRFDRLRQSEVQHLHRAIVADLDVGGLQIAMDDALLVRGLERLGDLLRDRQCLVDWNRALSQFGRRASAPRPVPSRAHVIPSVFSRP